MASIGNLTTHDDVRLSSEALELALCVYPRRTRSVFLQFVDLVRRLAAEDAAGQARLEPELDYLLATARAAQKSGRMNAMLEVGNNRDVRTPH